MGNLWKSKMLLAIEVFLKDLVKSIILICQFSYWENTSHIFNGWSYDNFRLVMNYLSFRKKLSNVHMGDWSQQSHNYVAKRYMENVCREVYFEDVHLQMDAKLWGEEYNRHRPPKQVIISSFDARHLSTVYCQTLLNAVLFEWIVFSGLIISMQNCFLGK